MMRDAPVTLTAEQYAIVGEALVAKVLKMGAGVRCMAVGATHLHLLYESAAPNAVAELGRAKQYASLKLPERPGRVWGRGAKIIVVRDIEHARQVWRYILNHGGKEGAWTWRYDRDNPVGSSR